MTSENEPRPESQTHQVFFISPIGEEGTDVRKAADQTLRHLVRKALAAPDYNVERADEDKLPGAITPRILSKIIDADLVIADLSGTNPNVFYELAVAHGHHKPVLHMQKSDERAPFDVKDMRIIRYQVNDPDKLEQAVQDLRAQAEQAINSPDVIETPLTATGRFQALDRSADPQAEMVKRLSAIEKAIGSGPMFKQSVIRASEDTFAIAEWVEQKVKEGAFSPDDIEALKTQDTSKWFDSWVDSLVARVAVATTHDDPWSQPATAQSSDPWAPPGVGSDEPPF